MNLDSNETLNKPSHIEKRNFTRHYTVSGLFGDFDVSSRTFRLETAEIVQTVRALL